jgi:polar amino acid transport system substrate-binding protein
MKNARTLVLCMALSVIAPVFAQQEPLRFLASSSWTMPYGDIQADRIQGGIVFDMAQAIGESLKLPVSFLVMPRNRTDAAVIAGDVDVRCFSNPAWTKIPDQHVWTKSLFEAPDVIVGRANATPLTSLKQVPAGTPIGTVLGFVYPTLEDRLADGRLLRDNANDGEKNLLKLTVGRFNYAVSNSLMVDWYLRQSPTAEIAKWRFPLNIGEFYCGVVKTARTDPERILSAIERLKSGGRLEKILAKYR